MLRSVRGPRIKPLPWQWNPSLAVRQRQPVFLSALWPGREHDLVRHAPGTVGSSVSRVVGLPGAVIRCPDSTADTGAIVYNDLTVSLGTVLSGYVYLRWTSKTNDASHAIFSRGAKFENNTNILVYLRFSTSSSNYRIGLHSRTPGGSDHGGEGVVNASIFDGNWHVVGWSWRSGSDPTVYLDGTPTTVSTGGSNTLSSGGSQSIRIGGASDYTSTRTFPGDIAITAVENSLWSDAEHRAIASNPFGVITPRRDVFVLGGMGVKAPVVGGSKPYYYNVWRRRAA